MQGGYDAAEAARGGLENAAKAAALKLSADVEDTDIPSNEPITEIVKYYAALPGGVLAHVHSISPFLSQSSAAASAEIGTAVAGGETSEIMLAIREVHGL